MPPADVTGETIRPDAAFMNPRAVQGAQGASLGPAGDAGGAAEHELAGGVEHDAVADHDDGVVGGAGELFEDPAGELDGQAPVDGGAAVGLDIARVVDDDELGPAPGGGLVSTWSTRLPCGEGHSVGSRRLSPSPGVVQGPGQDIGGAEARRRVGRPGVERVEAEQHVERVAEVVDIAEGVGATAVPQEAQEVLRQGARDFRGQARYWFSSWRSQPRQYVMLMPMRTASLWFAPPPWYTDPVYSSTEPRPISAGSVSS
jgi:hypothetical protein